MVNQAVIVVGATIIFSIAKLIYVILSKERMRPSVKGNCENINGTRDHLTNCLFCMKELNWNHETFALECQHKFHTACIILILKKKGSQKTCPFCRKIISKSDSKKLGLISD